MRTTLTLDEDVAQKAKEAAANSHRPLKQVINEALRAGLKGCDPPIIGRPYKTKPRSLGLREGLSYDNIHRLLEIGEGEQYR
jgi:hypothetical protein